MNIAVCVKLSPDAGDIQVKNDGSITLERAEWVIGGFDLQAIEAGARLAEVSGGKLVAFSAGGKPIDNSKLKKDVLSRGPDEMFLVVDDALANADTSLTAAVLAAAIRKHGPFDLVLCGEGSADLYFQQVGLQVGERLGWPTLNFISKITQQDGSLLIERTLEDEIEVLEVPLPAVLSVTSDINPPRLPNIKEILKASKKPAVSESLAELAAADLPEASIETLSTQAPRQAQRKNIMISGSTDDIVQALISYLTKEGLL